MKYFSTFSGVGGFELGIKKALPDAECIGYSEIDKYSIQTYKKNFGNEVKNYGDITKIDANGLPDFDFFCGGFPCQSFSIAGKRRGFEDTRGTMFFEIARILQVKKPRLILLENVKGLLNHEQGQTFSVIIQTLGELGYELQWMVLNSKFFGVPQNRERVFIIGSFRGEPRPEILPFRSSSKETDQQQSRLSFPTVFASQHKISRGMPMIEQPVAGTLRTFKDGGGFRELQEQGVSPCIPARAREDGNGLPAVAIPVLTPDRPEKRQNGRRFKTDGEESFTLTGQDIHGIMIRDGRDNRSCLRSGRTPEVGFAGVSIRRLTPVECERLQGFPDGWTEGVSDTQRYKQMGNAVTVNVIEALIKQIWRD